MLSREEAKELYDATRRWDYWTESMIPDFWGGSQKEDWKTAIEDIKDAAPYTNDDIEDVSIEAIMKLSELGVKRKKTLAMAILDYAFMTHFMGKGKGKRDESYKMFMEDGVLTDEGLRKLGDYYWEDCENGCVGVLTTVKR